jgi:hypothetical protein
MEVQLVSPDEGAHIDAGEAVAREQSVKQERCRYCTTNRLDLRSHD